MFFYSEAIEEIIQQIILNQWTEGQILSGSLATSIGDNFGKSVAINSAGNRIVVGAWNDEPQSGFSDGLAYVFISGANGWVQQQILSGSLVGQQDFFGNSVAINSDGDRIIVGAFYDEKATGNSNTGLAYIFVSGANGWVEQQVLSGSLATGSDNFFGEPVSMNAAGDRVVVGAYYQNSRAGLAYVFVSGTGGWIEQHILSGSRAVDFDDRFGSAVSINSAGDRIIVGAWQDELQNYNGPGLAYIFVSGTNGWTENSILTGSTGLDSGDGFGISVALNSAGDRAVVGAWQDQSATGQQYAGLAYVFISGTNGWVEQKILSGSFAVNTADRFGYSVAMNSAGDHIAVGAYEDETSPSPYNNPGAGLVYVFASGSDGWIQKSVLSGSLATDLTGNEYFGEIVAINSAGDKIVVGAQVDEGANNPSQSGLVYIFNGIA